jgi:hypothetical protein
MGPSLQNLKIMNPCAHSLCIVTLQAIKLNSPSFQMYIYVYILFNSLFNLVHFFQR